MSAFYTSSIHALSPHKKTLLASIACFDALPHSVSKRGSAHLHRCLRRNRAAALSTSCRYETSSHQPTYMQSANTFRKVSAKQRLWRGKGRGAQQQTVSKVLHHVHLSSWAKNSVGSIFNGLGAFASSIPNRLAEELNRLVRRSGKSIGSSKVAKHHQKMHTVLPVTEDTSKLSLEAKAARQAESAEAEREQHTFEKAMEDTNRSITSYYHAHTSPQYFPVKSKAQARLKAVCAEEEEGWGVFSKIPQSFMDSVTSAKKKPVVKKDFISRYAIEARTRALVSSLKTATSHPSKISRTQDLCKHLKQYHAGRHEAAECKAVPVLLRMAQSGDDALKEEALEALALLGYTAPVKGRGIRILTLDGGGTRGLMSIQCLKKLEELSNCKIYELFDFVCGVSTGALIMAMVCLYRLPLDECHRLYLDFSRQMFSRSRVIGTGGLVWNHAFYDSSQWEEILKTEIGHRQLIEFSRDPLVPKMCAISTLMNTPRLKNFVFRNYNLPPSTYSQYPGSCVHELWEVIRASSAAPGYYEDFPLGEYVHSDGGLSINNPTALAVHESRLLWPYETIQCVVSLGTGRYEPCVELAGCSKVSLKEKVTKIVDSATDTEGVHIMMMDLMPPGTYFRFNPYLSDDLQLDEIRQDRLDSMLRDTSMYLRKNERKMVKAVETLKQGRLAHQYAMDWLKFKADSLV